MIIRDLDSNGDGGLDMVEFTEVMRAARALPVIDSSNAATSLPHLVLNFDVNNTVVMLDSATGQRKLQ